MTKDEAKAIFRAWQSYVEVADKFQRLMLTPPPSFLPYPIESLEEALNIVAKEYFDSGNRDAAKTIQNTMASYLLQYYAHEKSGHMTDEQALEDMEKHLRLILSDPSLKKTVLENLKFCQQSWISARK
jgi:hypothetical protein